MAKYTKLVQNQEELIALKASNNFITPNVTLIYNNRTIDFNPYVPHDYSQDYLTIESLDDSNEIFWKSYYKQCTIYISTDNGTNWVEKTSTSSGTSLGILNIGDQILIKGNNKTYCNPGSTFDYSYFDSTNDFNVYGNIASLLFGDDFEDTEIVTVEDVNYDWYSNLINFEAYAFSYLFNNSKIISCKNLILPNKTTQNCYEYMFQGCTSLTVAPSLPATTLASGCYNGMFSGCTSLTVAPVLPATTLANYCYFYMFKDCTSLTAAPELPATTLVGGCYNNMFMNCTSLNKITCLATDISASNCTTNWVNSVAATGTFTKAASMTGWTTGPSGIPSGWTVEDAS